MCSVLGIFPLGLGHPLNSLGVPPIAWGDRRSWNVINGWWDPLALASGRKVCWGKTLQYLFLCAPETSAELSACCMCLPSYEGWNEGMKE